MRGAVLQKLGQNFFKERVVRRSYGFSVNRPFDVGKDPERFRYIDSDGRMFCKDTMQWCVQKVSLFNSWIDANSKGQKVPVGFEVNFPIERDFPEEVYKDLRPLITSQNMYTCEDDKPPAYKTNSGTSSGEYN
jgi:hypothetical protein